MDGTLIKCSPHESDYIGSSSSASLIKYVEVTTFKGQKEDAPCHFLSDEVRVDFDTERSRPPCISKIDLVVQYTEFLHEILNLLLPVVFGDVTPTCTENQAPLKMQTKEFIARPIGFVDEGEILFQRCTTIQAFWSLEHDDTIIVL